MNHQEIRDRLLAAPVIVVDIETDTEDHDGSFGDKIGLSYVANITWVSLSDGTPESLLIFDMKADSVEEDIRFIRDVLSRPGILVVGHNVVFDLRNLGGHFGFEIHLDSRVWDTQTMAILLLMVQNTRGDVSLEALTDQFRLLSADERAFVKTMKSSRKNLHTVDRDKVERYVGLDVVATGRLYHLQQAVIDTVGEPTTEPRYDDSGNLVRATGMRFTSSKGYRNLPELVDWEGKISRWCSNAAIRGIKLDIDWATQHLDQLVNQQHESTQALVRWVENVFDPSDLFRLQLAVDFETVLKAYHDGKTRVNWSNMVYRVPTFENENGVVILRKKNYDILPTLWAIHDTLMDGELKFSVEHLYENADNPVYVRSDPPEFDLEFWIEHYWLPDIYRRDDTPYRVRLLANWYRAYWKMTEIVTDETLVGKPAYAPFVLFSLLGCKFPTEEDIARRPELVTDSAVKLYAAAKNDPTKTPISLRDAAHMLGAWSTGDDATTFYLRNKSIPPNTMADHLMTALKIKTTISRSKEFIKHALRDGRIHTLLARKAQTGRAISSQPNQQNIDFKVFKGYLIPSKDTHMLISLDVNNAENYFGALTFGDSVLAEACAGDFHDEMTKTYWPELAAEILQRLHDGDPNALDDWNKLRKLSKFVTFGGAYGAGKDKLSRMIGCTPQEAAEIQARKAARFAAFTAGKRERVDQAKRLYARGIRPVYSELWTGRRVMLDEVTGVETHLDPRTGEEVEVVTKSLKDYTVTNYLQQGGVGELIWRSIVIGTEYFERSEWDTQIVGQLHDEIILEVPITRAFEVARMMSQIIANVVPELMRMMTTVPPVQFLSKLDGENEGKWGHRHNREYPLPTNVYANQWGIHTLEEGETKAPTWIVDHEHGTVEDLLKHQLDRLSTYYAVATDGAKKVAIQRRIFEVRTRLGLQPKDEPRTIFEALDSICESAEHSGIDLGTFRKARPVGVGGKDYGVLSTPNRFALYQTMYHAGKMSEETYRRLVVDPIHKISESLVGDFDRQFKHWCVKFQFPLPHLTP